MATNLAFPTSAFGRRSQSGSKPGVVSTALALLFALILGLSAADIQRQQILNAGTIQSASQDTRLLDGRGKWGGYL